MKHKRTSSTGSRISPGNGRRRPHPRSWRVDRFGSDRYETEFLGADLDADCAIEISHGLGEQYVFVQVIDLTEGSGNLVVAAQSI